MRILQVNNSTPTSQNKITFKSSVRELFQEASTLFLEECEALERELARPAQSVTEALMRHPFPPDELARQVSRAQSPEDVEAVFAPCRTKNFSDRVVTAFKALAEKAAEVLLGGSKDPLDVKALEATDRFFSMNLSPIPTEEAIGLYAQSIVRVGEVKKARPELVPMFNREG